MAEAEEAEAATAAAKVTDKDGGGMLGPALALVVTLIIGIGLGMLILGMITPEPVTEAEATDGQETDSVTDNNLGELLDSTEPMLFEDVITNLKSELSRYIKVRVEVWFDKSDPYYQKIIGQPKIKALLQEQMIEQLRTFDKSNLEDPFVLEQMRKVFTDKMDRELRNLFSEDLDRTFVRKVVISDFILQ